MASLGGPDWDGGPARRVGQRACETQSQGVIGRLTEFLIEHIMNMLIRRSPKRWLERPRRSAKRRRRRGENVAPAEVPQVERREAPHPYVIGVRAPSVTARGGPSQSPPGCGSQRTRRLPALHFPCLQGKRKKGKGRRPAPENRSARAAERCLPTFAKASAGRAHVRRSPPSGRRRIGLFDK